MIRQHAPVLIAAALAAACPGAGRAQSTGQAPPATATVSVGTRTAMDVDSLVFEGGIRDLQAALAAGRVTSAQLVDAYLARIDAYDRNPPFLHAILRVNPNARAEAARLDAERAAGHVRGPLHGIPVILKDNYDTADMPTSDGSVAMAGVVPPSDAFQVKKLREAGAVILAKANMHEYARGITTISSLGGQTLNPYDPTRLPGGSSGGSAVAEAASFAALAWGSDTCGSIRIPSAFNDLFGLRPTKGLSSIAGIIPLSHTQDVGGPLARTATDLAIGLDATVGPDPNDPATRILAGRPVPRFAASLDAGSLRGKRLGVLTSYFGAEPEDREAGRLVHAAIDEMKAAGAEVVDVAIPGLDSLVDNAGVINYEFRSDIEAYLARMPDAPVRTHHALLADGLFHVALEPRLETTDTVEIDGNAAYHAALARRDSARALVLQTMDARGLDAIVYPTENRPPAHLDEPQRGSTCSLSAVTGLPALSMPAGFTADGLPLGVELLGRPLADTLLLSMAYAYEQATHPRRAPDFTPRLVGGRVPERTEYRPEGDARADTALARFSFDAPTGTLYYQVALPGVAPSDAYAIGLHRLRDDGSMGGMVENLAGPGLVDVAGGVSLDAAERDALRDGRLLLVVFTKQVPLGAVQGVLRPVEP